jgi:hypothetical protein
MLVERGGHLLTLHQTITSDSPNILTFEWPQPKAPAGLAPGRARHA